MIKENIDIGKIYVKKHKIKFDVPDSFNAIIPKNTDEKNLKITVEKKSDIKLPVKKGQVLGVIKASDNGKILDMGLTHSDVLAQFTVMSDRIAVFRDGKLATIFKTDNFNEHK